MGGGGPKISQKSVTYYLGGSLDNDVIYIHPPTCHFQMSHLTEHGVGADLAHVPALICWSDVTNGQPPMFFVRR